MTHWNNPTRLNQKCWSLARQLYSQRLDLSPENQLGYCNTPENQTAARNEIPNFFICLHPRVRSLRKPSDREFRAKNQQNDAAMTFTRPQAGCSGANLRNTHKNKAQINACRFVKSLFYSSILYRLYS